MDHRKENQGERRRRWSAVDTVILLLVLLAIAGVVYRVVVTVRQETETAQETLYEVYFEVAEIPAATLAEIRGFDPVYLVETQSRLGYVGVYKDASTGGYRVALTPHSSVEAGSAERTTATGCMICGGDLLDDGSLSVPGSERYLTPGSELVIRTDRAILTVRITGIRSHS